MVVRRARVLCGSTQGKGAVCFSEMLIYFVMLRNAINSLIPSGGRATPHAS